MTGRIRKYGYFLLFLFALLQFGGDGKDPAPFLVKESCFFGDGSPFFVKEYIYDKMGRLIKEEQKDAFKTLGTSYSYGDDGTLRLAESWYNTSLLCRETYDYNEDGQQIFYQTEYDWGIGYKEETRYNEQRRKSLTCSVGYDDQGGGIWKTETVFFYDDSGNLTRTIKRIWNDWTEDNAPPMSETAAAFIYNEQGQLLLEQTHCAIRYSYDDQGRLIRMESSGFGTPVEEYDYDIDGNLTEKRKYVHGKLTYTYQYEYATPF